MIDNDIHFDGFAKVTSVLFEVDPAPSEVTTTLDGWYIEVNNNKVLLWCSPPDHLIPTDAILCSFGGGYSGTRLYILEVSAIDDATGLSENVTE